MELDENGIRFCLIIFFFSLLHGKSLVVCPLNENNEEDFVGDNEIQWYLIWNKTFQSNLVITENNLIEKSSLKNKNRAQKKKSVFLQSLLIFPQ